MDSSGMPSGSPDMGPLSGNGDLNMLSPKLPGASPSLNFMNSPDMGGFRSYTSRRAGPDNLTMPSPAFGGFNGLTPGYHPRRSPRLQSFSTPTFTMPSPALPSGLSRTLLEMPSPALRRSPRLGGRADFSPNAFFSGSGMDPGPMNLSSLPPGPAMPAGYSARSTNLKMEDDMAPPSGHSMSILNKLQQQNSAHGVGIKRQREEDLANRLQQDGSSGAMLPQYTPPVRPSAPPASQSVPTISQLPKPLISMISCPKTSGNGSGSSCHQCKSRRSINNLIFCCNMFTKRNAKEKRQKLGKEKRHSCRKKYCDQCLQKFYHEKAPPKRQDPSSTWQCPSCRGLCCCAACRRAKQKADGVDPLTMSPATSLACGLVYFKDMLKFKLGDPANPSNANNHQYQKALQSMGNGPDAEHMASLTGMNGDGMAIADSMHTDDGHDQSSHAGYGASSSSSGMLPPAAVSHSLKREVK